jgi:replication-associated recombination protein RarA
MMKLKTVRGYELLEVASALQKAIRRADARLAGYWAIELFESNYKEYLWRRLLVISAEDCWGVITHEVESLYRAWQMAEKHQKGRGRIFASKAVILLAMSRKCRDADHLTNLVYDAHGVPESELETSLDEARKAPEAILNYAYDCHTSKGKKAGKTKEEFFKEEFEALEPRQQGLFDADIEKRKH